MTRRSALLAFLVALGCALPASAGRIIPPIFLGGGGGGTAAPPYEGAFAAVTTLTVTAATHGMGTNPVPLGCWNNGTPRVPVAMNAGYPTIAANGDVVFTWTGSATGICKIVSGSASGTAGGDLSGAFPNPTIANGAVTSAKVLDGTLTTADTATGSKSGNGTKFATVTGTLTAGDCVEIDASGNLIESGDPCGTGSGGGSPGGTTEGAVQVRNAGGDGFEADDSVFVTPTAFEVVGKLASLYDFAGNIFLSADPDSTSGSSYLRLGIDGQPTGQTTVIFPVNGLGNVSRTVVFTSSINSEANLQTFLGGINILVGTELDSIGELQTLTGDNFALESEIDSLAEWATMAQVGSTAAGLVLASPTGTTGTPTFRKLVVSDLDPTAQKGNGSAVQLFSGSSSTGQFAKYDANGNVGGATLATGDLPSGATLDSELPWSSADATTVVNGAGAKVDAGRVNERASAPATPSTGFGQPWVSTAGKFGVVDDGGTSRTYSSDQDLDTEAEVRATTLKVVPRPDTSPSSGQAVKFGGTAWEYYSPVTDAAGLTGLEVPDNLGTAALGYTFVVPFAGDPNGDIACAAASGSESSELWRKHVLDTSGGDLYVCTTTGNEVVAEWTLVAYGGGGGSDGVTNATTHVFDADNAGADPQAGAGWCVSGGAGTEDACFKYTSGTWVLAAEDDRPVAINGSAVTIGGYAGISGAVPTLTFYDTDSADGDPSVDVVTDCADVTDTSEDCGATLHAVKAGAQINVFDHNSSTHVTTIGSSGVTGIVVTTDGTGNTEIQLPNDTIGVSEFDNTQTLSSDTSISADSVWFGTTGILFEGATGGAGSNNEGLLTVADPTADRTWTLPNASGTVSLSDLAETLTNKTLSADGTGNSITIPAKVPLEAASCAGTTGTLQWDTLATEAPTATCSAGSTNTALMRGVADFADSGQMQMQRAFQLPADFDASSNLDAAIKWRSNTSTTSLTAVWQIATVCTANAEVDDAAWNTASTVADDGLGTVNQVNDAAISNITKTGCAAGETMHVRILRDPAHASDDLGATASLMSVELTYRRAM